MNIYIMRKNDKQIFKLEKNSGRYYWKHIEKDPIFLLHTFETKLEAISDFEPCSEEFTDIEMFERDSEAILFFRK